MVPLGEEETDTPNDALSYIARNTVTTAVRESITINGAHVIRANIMADNGIMHVIDKVLVPAIHCCSKNMQHTARSGLLSILSKLGDDLERVSDFHRHRLWER